MLVGDDDSLGLAPLEECDSLLPDPHRILRGLVQNLTPPREQHAARPGLWPVAVPRWQQVHRMCDLRGVDAGVNRQDNRSFFE